MLLRTAVVLVLAGSVIACYGTKPPPPLSSPTPPAGLSTAPSGPSTVALPDDLPGLLAVYRQTLREAAHHLSSNDAESYAEADLQALLRGYRERKPELRAEVLRRLEHRQYIAPPLIGVPPTTSFPEEPDSVTRRSTQ